LTVLAVWKNKK